MTAMTPDEQLLWDYIEQESNELILKMTQQVENDGFNLGSPEAHGAETVALKILSAATVKMLAIISERVGGVDLVKAYMEMVPLHVELIKVYTFRALEREIRR